MLWYLECRYPESSHTCRLPLSPLPLRAGRRWNLPLVLPFPLVSWEHAEFVEEKGTLKVCDLNSKNGTFVNGRRVQEATLAVGDVIHLALVELRLGRAASISDLETSTTEMLDAMPDGYVEQARRFAGLMRTRAVDVLFQPIVSLRGGAPLGFELLGRGRCEGLPHSPMELLEIASSLGAAAELSQLFRTRGLEEANLHLGAGHGLFVNTHPAELQRPAELLRAMRQFRELAPNQDLTLEIHEKAITGPGAMRGLQAELHALGVRLAYDDFGAGYSRLADLAEAPPDVLKFDASLIRGLERAPAARTAVLSSMLRMAEGLDILTIAEGVETQADLESCRRLGFDAAQGYFCGRPAPAASFAVAQPA